MADDPTISTEDHPQIHHSMHQIAQQAVTWRQRARERILAIYQYVVIYGQEYGVSLFKNHG